MKIIDAHTHIDYLTHNFQSNVVGSICATKNESEWGILCDMIKRDKNIYGAFGIHPWFVHDAKIGFETRLLNLLETNRSFMLGEIGLDKYHPNMEKQTDVFIAQLNVAIKTNRPVFLHCVGAWDKILHILKQYKKSELPIIVAHAFNENEIILKQLLNYNMFFSFGKNVLCGTNCCIEQIDKNKILVESDGKNDIVLKDIIDRISLIKNDSKIYETIYQNTQRVIANGQIA